MERNIRYNPYSFFDNTYNHVINNVKYEICGNSIASLMTCIYIKNLKIMLDAGAHTPFNPKYIFITHTHGDHIQALPGIIMNLTTKPIIFCPYGSKKIHI